MGEMEERKESVKEEDLYHFPFYIDVVQKARNIQRGLTCEMVKLEEQLAKGDLSNSDKEKLEQELTKAHDALEMRERWIGKIREFI